MNDILWIILLAMAPISELRGAIIYGFTTDVPVWLVVLLATFFNALVGPLVYLFIKHIVSLFLHIEKISNFWNRVVVRSQHKLESPIAKYGTLGMAVFIGIPIPGTGVYTAAIGAYALGYSFRKFFVSSIIGVLLSATIVTILSFFGQGLL